MKQQGPKKRFLTVEGWEAEILSRVDSGVPGKLKELVDEFKDVFPDTLPKGRPPKRDIVHKIRTEECATPPSRPPYRFGPAEQDEIEEQVKDLLAQGFISPSASPYGVPILSVPKKDGRWRICIDFRALNKQIVKDQFPLPRIDSLLERLGQATVFMKLNLASGYHQTRWRILLFRRQPFVRPGGILSFSSCRWGCACTRQFSTADEQGLRR